MRAQRRGSDLKTHIAIALHSLGRDYEGATKGMAIADMEDFLKGLRSEQLERGIIKPMNETP